jgi:hypothetical protein
VAASLDEATTILILENDGLVCFENDGLVGLQNDGLVGLEIDGLVDEINKYYDDHDGLIAIDEDNYNHDCLVDLNNDNDDIVDLDNDNDCLVSLECDGVFGFECDNLVGDVFVSDLSDSEEMGGMSSLPEPNPVQYFLMNHQLYPELQQLGIRNGMSFVPFATRAQSLDEVEILIIQHFPPRKDDIKNQGIFHSNKDDRMPAERTWGKVLKCAVKALGRHGLDEASATKFLMDKTMGANIIPFDNVCTWYSNKNTRPLYDAFAQGGTSSYDRHIQGSSSGLSQHQGGSHSWRGAVRGHR